MPLKEWSLPPNYYGEHWDGWLVGPCTMTRDSDALERSNFDTLIKTLEAVDARPEVFVPMTGNFQVVEDNHWAVGWVRWVAIRPEAKHHIAACENIIRRLEQYPVLDEELMSQHESEDN